MPPTHEVFNQPPVLDGYDVADDPAMLAALRREGADWAEDGVRELGRRYLDVFPPGGRDAPQRDAKCRPRRSRR